VTFYCCAILFIHFTPPNPNCFAGQIFVMRCSAFYFCNVMLHQELETYRTGKYKNTNELVAGGSPAVSLEFPLARCFCQLGRGGKKQKGKPHSNALENYLQNTISVYFSISVPTDLLGTNLFLTPPSSNENEKNKNNRCNGQ